MILIVADQHDLHALHVRKLIHSLGHQSAIVDPSKLAACGYAHDIGRSSELTGHSVSNANVNFRAVRTIWLRRPSVVDVPEHVVDRGARQFLRHEWSEAVNGMMLGLPKVRWINHPVSQAAASKPYQLELAQQIGLAVPDTLITNDPARVREFLDAHRQNVVHKSLTSPSDRLIDVRRWSEDDAPFLDSSLPLAPVVFQELIEGPADIRCVAINGEFLSVRIDAETSRSEVDSRLDLDASYATHELPREVVELLSRLMAGLGLVFGVIDMKLDARGNYVFFEINPQGQFLFMEILTDLPISRRIAEFLSQGE